MSRDKLKTHTFLHISQLLIISVDNKNISQLLSCFSWKEWDASGTLGQYQAWHDVGMENLMQWNLNNMAAIVQKTFATAFCWRKIVVFWHKFHWCLFLRVSWRDVSTGLGYGLVPNRWQDITWNNLCQSTKRNQILYWNFTWVCAQWSNW